MSNSEYLKRLAAPRAWIIARKTRTFVTKPNPGSHPLSGALPLALVLKQVGAGSTTREIKKVLIASHVLVNGRRVADHRFPLGLFDWLEIDETKQAFRLMIDNKGRLVVLPSDEKTRTKPCKVIGKTVLRGGKLQLNLADSKNVLAPDNKIAVGDTVVLSLPSNKIVATHSLKPGANVLITAGRYVGQTCRVDAVERGKVRFTINDAVSETQKRNTLVIP